MNSGPQSRATRVDQIICNHNVVPDIQFTDVVLCRMAGSVYAVGLAEMLMTNIRSDCRYSIKRYTHTYLMKKRTGVGEESERERKRAGSLSIFASSTSSCRAVDGFLAGCAIFIMTLQTVSVPTHFVLYTIKSFDMHLSRNGGR